MKSKLQKILTSIGVFTTGIAVLSGPIHASDTLTNSKTVVIEKEAIEEESDENCCDKKTRTAGSFGIQMLRLDTDPLVDLAKKERILQGKNFDFEKRLTPMFGFMGHHETRSGFRGGMSAWVGYHKFQSDIFPKDSDTATHDSIMLLRIFPAYAGFNFDKVFHYYSTSISFGGMLGGGAYILQSKKYDYTMSDVFYEPPSDSIDTLDSDDEMGNWAWAPFTSWEVHAGISTALASSFHVGVEFFTLFNYSPEGFGVLTGDFFTVNPGIRFKLIFGRA